MDILLYVMKIDISNAGIFYITRVSFLSVIKYKSKGRKKHESN